MTNKLSEILKRGIIQSEEENEIVFEDWVRLMDSRAGLEELEQHNKLLRDWEDKQELDEDE